MGRPHAFERGLGPYLDIPSAAVQAWNGFKAMFQLLRINRPARAGNKCSGRAGRRPGVIRNQASDRASGQRARASNCPGRIRAR
jgi:hypothetical protein